MMETVDSPCVRATRWGRVWFRPGGDNLGSCLGAGQVSASCVAGTDMFLTLLDVCEL